jgi:hypothetical protein
MSTLPNFFSAASTSLSMSFSLPTSVLTKNAFPAPNSLLILSSAVFPFCSLISAITTFAPSQAVAKPRRRFQPHSQAASRVDA